MPKLTELTKEEAEALTKDLTAVLEKHNCELGIKSTIELLKRVEDTPSTYIEHDGESKTEENPKAD